MTDPLEFGHFPTDLPRPSDDGKANHLIGMKMPSVVLRATSGDAVDVSHIPGRAVLYAYPMTGQPGVALPEGWNDIPGARGCTPETLGFKDADAQIRELGATVYGLSTQDTEYQQEMAQRLAIPFSVLSDAEHALTGALDLPTMKVEGATLLKRLTLIIKNGVIEHVFYPVFPPDEAAANALAWLKAHPA